MSEVCIDNRFEVIEAYKKKLIESTNIETSPEEMAVIDNVLFRFWQLGWLPPVPHGRLIDADDAYHILTNYYHHSTELQHYELREALARVSTIIPAEERPAEDTNAPTTYDLLYEEGGPDTR